MKGLILAVAMFLIVLGAIIPITLCDYSEDFSSLASWRDEELTCPPNSSYADIVLDPVGGVETVAVIYDGHAIQLDNPFSPRINATGELEETSAFWFNFSFYAVPGADFNVILSSALTTDAVLFTTSGGSAYGESQDVGLIDSDSAAYEYWAFQQDISNLFNSHWDDPAHSLVNGTWQDISILVVHFNNWPAYPNWTPPGGSPYNPPVSTGVQPFLYVNGTYYHYGVGSVDNTGDITYQDSITINVSGDDLYIDNITIAQYGDELPEPTEPYELLFPMDYLIFLLMVLIPTMVMYGYLGYVAVVPTFDLMCAVAFMGNIIPLSVLIIAILISLGTYINRGGNEYG